MRAWGGKTLFISTRQISTTVEAKGAVLIHTRCIQAHHTTATHSSVRVHQVACKLSCCVHIKGLHAIQGQAGLSAAPCLTASVQTPGNWVVQTGHQS